MIEGISISVLPESWRYADFGSFCDFRGGTQPPKSTFKSAPTSGYVRLLQIRDFETDKHAVYVPANDRLRIIQSTDISIARYGASVGRILSGKQGAINVAIMTALPDEKQVTKPFLRFALQHADFQSYISGLGGRAAQAGFNKGEVSRFKLPLPPLAEQRKISAFMNLVHRAIDQQERLMALTQELKRGLLRQLFMRGLRGEAQKQTELGPMPQSWEIMKLGGVAKVGNGSTPKRDNDGYWQGGSIPWLNSSKIHELFINQADQFVTALAVKECHLPQVKPGSLLIAITGQGKTLGNTALVRFETCINQHLAYASFTSPKVFPEFVLWFMQTRYDHLRSISQAGGSTKGALTCGYLKTYPIPLPAFEEQREIAGVFSVLERKLKSHERQYSALKALSRSLLHKLMTAQLRIDNLDLDTLNAIEE